MIHAAIHVPIHPAIQALLLWGLGLVAGHCLGLAVAALAAGRPRPCARCRRRRRSR